MFTLWPEAREEMPEILAFWFPYEGLAAIFADGLTRAGFPVAGRLCEMNGEPSLRVGDRLIDAAVP